MALVLAAGAAYEAAVTALRGQTLGKELSGIQVVRRDDELTPKAEHTLLRWSIPAAAFAVGVVAVTAAPLPVGGTTRTLIHLAGGPILWLVVCASPPWDHDRRGWHDKIAGTIVIDADQPPGVRHGPQDHSPDGGNGDDTLWGGLDADTLTGGTGADALKPEDRWVPGPGAMLRRASLQASGS